MRRVAVIGNGGAGKTWLSRRLAARLGLPVVHLDARYYDADWRAMAPEEWADLQRQLVAEEVWVLDGNYLQTLPIRLARADAVILVDPHPLVCAFGLLSRRLRHGGGQHPDCGVYDRLSWGFLRYVLSWRRRHRPRVLEVLAAYPDLPLVHLHSRRAVRRWLTTL